MILISHWSTPHDSCPTAALLISLTDSLFVNQKVNEPTRLDNILDLIFGPDDHSITPIILTETSLPICTKSLVEFNPATSGFDKLDFNKGNWVDLRAALKSLSCTIEEKNLSTDPTDVIISKVFESICHHCITHVPSKTCKRLEFPTSIERGKP